MPNHITNEMIFRCAPDKQREILALVWNAAEREGKGGVDFNILVPIPNNVWLGSVSSLDEKRFGNDFVALDWCRAHWGTKCGAYQCQDYVQTDESLTLIFDTAWSPPWTWALALFNTIKMPFTHNWLDEGKERAVRTEWKYDPEDKWDRLGVADHDVTDDEQRRIHKMKWGIEEFPPEDDDEPAVAAVKGGGE